MFFLFFIYFFYNLFQFTAIIRTNIRLSPAMLYFPAFLALLSCHFNPPFFIFNNFCLIPGSIFYLLYVFYLFFFIHSFVISLLFSFKTPLDIGYSIITLSLISFSSYTLLSAICTNLSIS